MTKYADLADLREDERITIIGNAALTKLVAVAIDDEPKKIKRYITKVTTRFTKVRHISTGPGIAPNTVTISFGPLTKH